MRNADHLMFPADQAHLLGNLLCGTTADPHIDFIKDQCLDLIFIRHDCLDCKHDAGKFTAGCHSCKRSCRFTRIQGDHKFHLIRSFYCVPGGF